MFGHPMLKSMIRGGGQLDGGNKFEYDFKFDTKLNEKIEAPDNSLMTFNRSH